MKKRNVALLIGSFRIGSLNARLAKAIMKSSPDALSYKQVKMEQMPFYNEDLEGDRPDSVRKFVAEVAQADAVCIVTPEYNRSIPAVLKNAIDWGSKPAANNVWRDKPVAMTGTSPGAIGTAFAQQHLRQSLAILGAHVMPGEVYISFKPSDLIDDDGNVSEERVAKFIEAFATRFSAYIERLAV